MAGLLTGVGALVVQLSGDGLLGVDGYYHIKMAALTLREGIPLGFPYLHFTVLDEDRFWDMHMLFHVFQAPFTLALDPGLAAKASTSFWFGAALGLMYWIMRQYEVRLPALWILLVLAASEGFIYRMGMPRAQVFGLIYSLLAFHLLMQRRVLAVGVLALLFAWTYKGFLILGPLTAFGLAAHYLETRRVELRLAVSVAAGILAGLVVNPYFPNDVWFLWGDVLQKILSGTYMTSVGGEWYPYDTRELMSQAGVALLAYAAGLLLIVPGTGRWDRAVVFWALTATLWLFMLLKSQRFVEYFPPAAVMFLAFTCRERLKKADFGQWLRSPVRIALSWGVVVILGAVAFKNVQGVYRDLQQEPPVDAYRGAADWLARNTPEGSRVFHTDWDDFPMLFFHNSHNTYILGLDPDYMRTDDALLYELWSDISEGLLPGRMEHDILQVFGAKYVFTDNKHTAFRDIAENSAAFVNKYSDAHATVYHIVPPPELEDDSPRRESRSVPEPSATTEPPSWW